VTDDGSSSGGGDGGGGHAQDYTSMYVGGSFAILAASILLGGAIAMMIMESLTAQTPVSEDAQGLQRATVEMTEPGSACAPGVEPQPTQSRSRAGSEHTTVNPVSALVSDMAEPGVPVSALVSDMAEPSVEGSV